MTTLNDFDRDLLLAPAPTQGVEITSPTPTFEEVYPKLLAVGFLTGSRGFGCNKTEDSDHDIGYHWVHQDDINLIIKGMNRVNSSYFNGYKVTTSDGKVINLIPLISSEILPWFYATQAIKGSVEGFKLIDNRERGHSVFQGLVQLYKATLPITPSDAQLNLIKGR